MSAPWWWLNLQPQAIWWSTRVVNEHGLRVTSAWRSRAAQRRLWLRHRGSPLVGAHPIGEGVDFYGPESAMQRAAMFARDHHARQVLIHDAGTGRHLHIDWRGAR